MIMKRVFLGLGTNLGDKRANLENALASISESIGMVTDRSSVYETEPWGFRTDDTFLNMVVQVETKLKPSGLLGRILMIEAKMGRLRSGKEYASRIIDIDILFFGDVIMNTKSLAIPHPKMHERKFVLVPLCEIAPDLMHPVLNKNISILLSECKDKGQIRMHDSTTARQQDL